jgi:hypothetical protein
VAEATDTPPVPAAASAAASKKGKKAKVQESSDDPAWRKGLVGKFVEVPFGSKFHHAVVDKHMGNGVFQLKYTLDAAVEKLKLFKDLSGTDCDGEEKFEWRMAASSTAPREKKNTRGAEAS